MVKCMTFRSNIKLYLKLYLIEHAPNLNSIWNKLSVTKNCSKSKRLGNTVLYGMEYSKKFV